MIPLKRKKISELVAKEMNLPVDLVDDIVSFYYKHVQKKLSALSHPYVNVPALGTFALKERSVRRKLEKYEGSINKMENLIETDSSVTMRKYESILDMRNQVNKFKSALSIMEEEKERKKQKREERKNYETESNNNLERKGKNPGRSEE